MKIWKVGRLLCCVYLLLVGVFVLLVLVGCGTKRTVTVTEVKTDSVYIERVRWDSIYIRDSVLREVRFDTVWVEKYRIDTRYKVLRDTVWKQRVDSVPVIKEVEVVREKNSRMAVFALWFMWIVIVLCVVWVAWKVWSKWK